MTETGWDTMDETTYAPATRRLYNRLVTMSDVGGVMFHTLRDAPVAGHGDDRWGFFWKGWNAKPRACLFVRGHGGTWPGC